MEVTRHSIFLFDEERAFKTSLNIIGEVMNVPMCALSSILRANGYEEVASDSICIDEKMLSYFADAYIRKMKNYFLSSVRNIENLTYQEFTDLNEFYNTFKKQEAKYTRRAEWSHIDTGLLRNAFMDKIKKLTPRRKSRFELFFERLVEKCGYDTPCFTLDYRDPSRKNLVFETPPPDILCRVSHTRYYLVRQKTRKKIDRPVNIMRQFFIAARYHIFVADDTDSDGNNTNSVNKPSFIFKLISNKYEQRTTFKKYRCKQSFRRRQIGSQTIYEAKSLRRVHQAYN